MSADVMLTPADRAVLDRVRAEWFDENYLSCEIAAALHQRTGVVMRRVQRFVVLGLVERRQLDPLVPKTDIRRVGK